jgi:hypothetical protein
MIGVVWEGDSGVPGFSCFWAYHCPFAGCLVGFLLWLWRFTDRSFRLSLNQLYKRGEKFDN